MTRRSNARIAGITFLVYIVAGMAVLNLPGEGHAAVLLNLVCSFSALVLAVTLYALTREVDREIALLAMACRVIEAVPAAKPELFFAVGSTLFCWLFLRGRLIPAALAWLGVFASVLLVVALPLQYAGLLGGQTWSASIAWLQWMPMLLFEVTLALLLIFKGVAPRPSVPAA
jgi:Domain of unknown function (DUF4386)